MISATFTGTERFELLRQIGAGGFGIVYEALDRESGSRVALKVLRHADGAALYRFKREFRAIADIHHRNLVTLHELLTDGRDWFFTMELVRAEPWTSYVRPGIAADDGPAPAARGLDESRLRAVLPQLVDALGALHARGIVHRDIKPSNVLVTGEGRVVLLDFGLVSEHDPALPDHEHSTDPSSEGLVVLGTPAYMAPEQGVPGGAAPAADWYSVGVLLYEALAGKLPFEGTGLSQMEAKLAGTVVPAHYVNASAPRDLSELSLGLLEVEPDDRQKAIDRLKTLGAPDSVLDSVSQWAAPELLVGRDAHLQELRHAYEAAMQGTTVVATVTGVSGMGKTALVRRFLAEQARWEPDLIALTSRCHERESTPYKAVDPLVDAVARYLRRLKDIEVARLLPRDAALLARLFPVLRAVDEVRRAPEHGTSGLDSIALRRRAAIALRDLLFELAVRVPLVLSIDDAQWGDADSAAILEQILQPPDAPPMLLIAAYRSEDAASAPVVAALNRLGRQIPAPAVRTIVVGALHDEEARLLAMQLTSADAATLAVVAHESGGNPFFVHELARHTTVPGHSARLEDVILRRVAALPDDAQSVMRAIALSAQALPPAVIQAAVPGGDAVGALQTLSRERLARVSGHGDLRTVESYHDRIREAVVGHLDAVELEACHQALAHAWEGAGRARPDTLTTHFHGAGDISSTIRYGAIAAEQARDTLAFDRAAELYALLVTLSEDPGRRREWQVALGDALVNCGRGYEAATAYRAALALNGGDEVIELERRAAAELIRAGYLEEATDVLKRLLPKVGVRPPGGHVQALVTLLTYRALVAVRGLGVRQRPEHEVERAILERVDVLVSIAPPLTLISLPRGLALNMKAVWHALNAGEPKRAAVALALFGSTTTMNGTKSFAGAMRAVELSKVLAAPLGDPWTTARTELAEGICFKVSGFWQEGIQALERAIETFYRCPGARWEIETAQTLRHDALIWTGEWRKLAGELPGRRDDANARGDRYSVAQVAGRLSPLMRLAEDRLADARLEVEAAQEFWRQPHFNLQHRAALCALLEIDLYSGRPAEARQRLKKEWPALRGTLSMFQNGRVEMQSYRARAALALGSAGQAGLYAEALDCARRLEAEHAGYADALASLIRATVAQGEGNRDRCLDLLVRAEEGFHTGHMRMLEAVSQYRRGHLIGGDAGDDLVEHATLTMRAEGVVAPERIADLLAPGAWRTA